MIHKALSVRQPHASQIAAGVKTLEIRSRRTRHRGPLLICASARFRRGDDPSLPRGVSLCIVDVVDSRPMIAGDEAAAGIPLRPGHYAWVLADRRSVPPQPVKGQLGLFNVELTSPMKTAAAPCT